MKTACKSVYGAIFLLQILLAMSSAVSSERLPARMIDYSSDLFSSEVMIDKAGIDNETDDYIRQVMSTYHIAGVSAVIIKNNRILWTGTYGYSNFEENIPVADTTSFMLASISKTMTGTALMQLWENGWFELDDHINDYLPFTIYNPNYPGQEITFRQVLTHTSSLRDNWSVMYSVYSEGDCPIPLGEYVEEYFTPGGEYYNTISNFYNWAPEAGWSYCNEAFALAGFLVEAITGIDFNQYSRDSIFIPLGMEHTSWFLAGLDTLNVAMPYTYSSGSFMPLGQFGYADYPAGQLRSSTLDLARHIMVYLNHGEVDGVRILDSATVAEMLRIQFASLRSDQGLVWFRTSVDGKEAWQHGGGDQGVSTLARFCPETNTGVIVLTNGESGAGTGSILGHLFEYASRDILLTDNYLADDAGGDADGIPEPGETVEMVCTFTNLFADEVSGVEVELIIDDAALKLLNNYSYLGDIAPNDTAVNDDQPFVFEIPTNYISRICSFSVALSWNGGTGIDTIVLDGSIGGTSILLIDDDNGRTLDPYFTGSLNRMRIPYHVLLSPPVPELAALENYEVVVWFTGDYRVDPLDADEIAVMKSYADGGGSLFLTGQGVAAQLSTFDVDFLNNYLKADYLSTSLIPVLTAAPGGSIFDITDTIAIHGSGGALNQTDPDHLTAINGGIDEMFYYNGITTGAVSYSGDYKLVFFGFGFEAIVSGDVRWTDRDVILSEILDFFGYIKPFSPMILAILPGDVNHLVDHNPEISWSFGGDQPSVQEMYHVQVGIDDDWSTVEMWDTGPVGGSETSVIYAGSDLNDGESYYLRVRIFDGTNWSSWYYFEMRMNSRPSVPTGLSPANMIEIDIPLPALSHNNAEDNEGDVLTYSYDLYDDSLLSSLVAHASDCPQNPEGITVWTVPTNLSDGEDYYWRVRANDGFEYGDWSDLEGFWIKPLYICGDANNDEIIDVGDAVYVINYVFKGGAAPVFLEAGDANADGWCDVGDAVYMVSHIFRGGPEPQCPHKQDQTSSADSLIFKRNEIGN